MNSQNTFPTSHDQITPSLKAQKKPRGKINTVACDRCKRDKKKCDGNYLTKKACKYCHNHNETCVFSEPNFLRISRILNAARKNAVSGENPEKSIQDLEEQIIKYENTIISLISQIENKNESKTIDLIGNVYLSLFSNPAISSEQTIILKKLCEITNNANTNIDNENLNKILNKLLILTSNDSTQLEISQSWEVLETFVINNNLIDNIIPLAATNNFFGISYPSGSTTPIPSPQPQFLNNDQFQNNDYKPNNHMTTKKRKIEHIAIRPSKKDTNVLVWHQNDPCEDVPLIAVHAPQNNHSIDNETIQSPDISFDNVDNISSNENLQFSTLFSSQESYGLDDVGLDEIEQFSNVTSPTFSSNSISDDNMEFPTYLPNPPVDLFFFPNSTTFNETF